MAKIYQGDKHQASGRYSIVVSRYNESITSRLLTGAIDTLTAHGIAADSIEVAWVPGAWELPVVARRLAQSRWYHAIICLGAVIRGETSHDEHINRQVSLSLGQTAVETGIPVLFGLLTCHSLEQAIQRAGGNMGNKGAECAEAALEMVSLLAKLP